MRACIAIIDSTKARICEYDERNGPGHELQEVSDKVNLGRRHIAEAFTDQVPDGQAFADSRDEKFAREVVAEIDRIVREGAFTHLVIVAAPRLLGDLRKYDAPLRREGLKLDEYDRDLGGMNDAQLHDHLSHAGLIAPRQRIAAAR